MSLYLYQKIIIIPAILIAFVAQGYAKAKMADKLGDKTPRFQGRVSLNPLNHIDLIGFVMIILTGFGWTKPLTINPSAFKRGYKDEIKVTLAGILVNLLVAFITMVILLLWGNFAIKFLPYSITNVGYEMLWNISLININLFVFNLLPIPGLAGFDLFRELSPKNFYKYGSKLYEYQMAILLIILFLGSYILRYPVILIFTLFAKIAGLILGIFI